MSLHITILKESLNSIKSSFLSALNDKAGQLHYLMQKEPSESLIKRINKEEKLVKDSIAYHEMVTTLIKELERENQELREKVDLNRKKIDYLIQANKHWMSEYDEIVSEKLKIDYEIEKKLKALKELENGNK